MYIPTINIEKPILYNIITILLVSSESFTFMYIKFNILCQKIVLISFLL